MFGNEAELVGEVLFNCLPLLIWIIVLFYFSTGKAAFSNTSRFIQPVLRFLFPKSSDETLKNYHAYIRKFSHFAGYAILALLAFSAFSAKSINFSDQNRFFAAFGVVILIASLDEFHQSFYPSRHGSIKDVLLDVFGGLTMLAAIFLYRFI